MTGFIHTRIEEQEQKNSNDNNDTVMSGMATFDPDALWTNCTGDFDTYIDMQLEQALKMDEK